jgi:hypothetical protein
MCNQNSNTEKPARSRIELLTDADWQLVEAYDPWGWLSKGQPKPQSFPRISDGPILSLKEDGNFTEKHSRGFQCGGVWRLIENDLKLELQYTEKAQKRDIYKVQVITENRLQLARLGRHGMCVDTYESRLRNA